MSAHKRFITLLIFGLACIIMEPTWVTCSGTCNYGCHYGDCDYWYPSWADIEQYYWYGEVNNFLNCEDCSPFGPYYYYHYGAPSQPYYYGMPSLEPNYSVAPVQAQYYSMPSLQSNNNSTPVQAQYFGMPIISQGIGNDAPDYWLNEANRLYLAGSYAQAAASYANGLKLDPHQSIAWLNMGTALYFLNRFNESLDAYNAALVLEPRNANAYLGKSKALLALDRINEANVAQDMANKLQGPKPLQIGSRGDNAIPTVIP